MQKKALVIIDIQNDITKNYKGIIDNINLAIDWAVSNNIHIVYIRHENLSEGTRTFKPNTCGAELVSDLKIVSQNIFTKYKGNALTSEAFADFISKNEISDFYLTGADAVACVKSTCYNLCKAGYAVTVLSDCVTSYDKRKIDEMLKYYESQGSKIISLRALLTIKFEDVYVKKEKTTKQDLFNILDLLDSLDMRYWVDGGWGVDILLGKETRAHRDIDIDFDAAFTNILLEQLKKKDYEVATDWQPCRIELYSPNYGYIDIHPLVISDDGKAKQASPDDGWYYFESDFFTKAVFETRTIPCISAKAQKLFHSGYELREVDKTDLKNIDLILSKENTKA